MYEYVVDFVGELWRDPTGIKKTTSYWFVLHGDDTPASGPFEVVLKSATSAGDMVPYYSAMLDVQNTHVNARAADGWRFIQRDGVHLFFERQQRE